MESLARSSRLHSWARPSSQLAVRARTCGLSLILHHFLRFNSIKGMAGAIYIKGVAVTKYKRSAVKDVDEWPSKYSKFYVELDDGLELSFTDKRRFARVRLLNDPTSVPPLSELGPDALLEPMAPEELAESLQKKKTEIKALLLDQSFISGIGNWVADEVLYQARIHPKQMASSLSKENCSALCKCIKEVIEKAVEVRADSSQYPAGWIFHSREKKPGKAFVDGKKIDFITAGGRTTAYVPELQKLSQDVKETGKPKRRTSNKNKGEDEDDDDDNTEEPAKEEKNAGTMKSKKGTKGGGKGKKQSKKNKSKESDDDNDGENDETGDAAEDDDDQAEKKPNQVTKSRQAKEEKKSNKRVNTSQTSKNAKRKVKS